MKAHRFKCDDGVYVEIDPVEIPKGQEPNSDWVEAPFEEHRLELIDGKMVYSVVTEPPPIPKDFNIKNYWNGESK